MTGLGSVKDIDKSKFKVVGKNTEKMESIGRPNLTYAQDIWRRLRSNKIAFAGMIVIIFYICMSIVMPMVGRYDYTESDAMNTDQGPSAEHWFGTDTLGRDLWARSWMGARVSLFIGFAATFINYCIGCVVGGLSGYYGGWVDMVIMRIIDVLYGIPTIIVTILMMVVLGPGIQSLILAMIMVGWIGCARFVRGEVLKLKESDFVAAAKILGASDGVIIFRHILPNILGMVLTNWMMAIPGAIFQEAFLSYIGIGIRSPGCSWGILAKEGSAAFDLYPHKMFVPAFFVSTTMLALNLFGDGLRDAMDPRLRNQE